MTMWVDTETGAAISTEGMIAAHPNTSFPIPFEPLDGYELLDETMPAFDPDMQRVEASETASLIGGRWTRTFTVLDLTPEEVSAIRKARVPAAVTMRQGRLALLGAGKLALVQAAIDALPEPQRGAAKIEWEYSNELQRNNPFVITLGAALGLTEDAMDELFIAAAQL